MSYYIWELICEMRDEDEKIIDRIKEDEEIQDYIEKIYMKGIMNIARNHRGRL